MSENSIVTNTNDSNKLYRKHHDYLTNNAYCAIINGFNGDTGFIALDETYAHRKKYVRTVANKIGISGPLENPLELLRIGD